MNIVELGTFCIIRLEGNLTIDNAVDTFKELKNTLGGETKRQFVLVFSKVKDVDSAGIGAVIAAAAWSRGKGHRIYLCAPTPKVRQQMQKQDLTGFFPLIENEFDLLSRMPD